MNRGVSPGRRSYAALALAGSVAVLIVTCRADVARRLAPSVDAGPSVRAHPREPVMLKLRLSGSWKADGPRRFTIDWGDRSTEHGAVADTSGPVTVSHVYAAVGRDTVRVTVTGKDGEEGSDTLTAFVEAAGTPQVFVGAGDIATCSSGNAAASSKLLDSIPGTVFTLGDNAYPSGRARDYSRCYAPTWGRHKRRTHPVPGNHEYDVPGATGYFDYFGVAAGDSGKGYYTYELGDWHIVALNSNLAVTTESEQEHRQEPGDRPIVARQAELASEQEQWLRADLAAHPKRCTLAYFHHPRFSSGTSHGSDPQMQPLWQVLYDAGADVVLTGHEHNYERFAPQTPDGRADSARGIREFVAGTGGGPLYQFGPPIANSEVRSMSYGVLKLTLGVRSYEWQFIPIAGGTFTDSGSAPCH